MYEELPTRTEGPVRGYRVSDRVSEADVRMISNDLDEAVDEYGTVRLYVEYENVPVPDLDAIDDDVAFWLAHREHLDRYAVVGESQLLEWAAAVGDRLTGVEVDFFDHDDRDEAWAWVREGTQ
jgi:hypothetical protein